MASTSQGLHEPERQLSNSTLNRHRAIASIIEELEAVDWYDQRVEATDDTELAQILAHNRDEEKEHAAMVLEWLRRHDSALDTHLRTYLFSSQNVVEIESDNEQEPAQVVGSASHVASGRADGSLGIGSLKGAP